MLDDIMRPVHRGTIPPKGQPHLSSLDAPTQGGHGQPWLQPLPTASTPHSMAMPQCVSQHQQQRTTSSQPQHHRDTPTQQVLRSYVGSASPLLRSSSGTSPSPHPTTTSYNNHPTSSFHAPTLLGHAAEDATQEDDVMRRGVWPPPSLQPQEVPMSQTQWEELSVKKSKTPNLNYLLANRAQLNRPYSRTPLRVELRQRVMSGTPTIRVPRDSTHLDSIRMKDNLKQFEAPHPAAIEASLNEDLACIDSTDNYRRLHAHRVALERFIAIQGPTAQSLLKRVLACYEEVELHQFSQHFDEVTKRFQASEAVAREALTERNALRHHAESLRLDIINLERQLHAKEEMLAEIATSHRINVNAVNWMTGGTNPTPAGGGDGSPNQKPQSRSMAEIRTIQERVASRHGESQRQAAKEAAMAATITDHSLLTTSLRSGGGRGDSSVMWADAAAERRAQQELSDADHLLAGGIGALHGHSPGKGSASDTAAGGGSEGNNDLSEIYIHAQRTDNLGIVLSPVNAPIETSTHLPGESPRARNGAQHRL
ncbi:Hypothetical protein, putative [Bodo saltans]|uniref:Uncharacterized protein n=1 Tax=Bodo saltans TaxID=75058 RepID=A0A0S4JPV1_BODSA|nr:Hypothetical protein, putative [Bodo saltans]|eukprot:CUG92276.1 Hypothetical protein, putative [Bodo saltans]